MEVNTYYNQFHRVISASYPALSRNIEVDCCIIGGGIAGLSVARELTDHGIKVAILEGHHIAWGASGRNGGFVSPGFALSLGKLRKRLGNSKANRLYQLSIEGVDIVRQNIQLYAMEKVVQTTGELDVIRYNRPRSMKEAVKKTNKQFSLNRRFVDKEELQSGLSTSRYHAGMLQPTAFQIHPLNYCLQLAASIVKDGGLIFEHSQALTIHTASVGQVVQSAQGKVHCTHVIHCSSAYSTDIEPRLKRAVLPVSTHVTLTEPSEELGRTIMSDFNAVLDNRRASDYFRLVESNRLLWGGAISTLEPSKKKLERILQARIYQVFPQLKPIKLALTWTGKMGYATHLMPHVGKIDQHTWICTAFGGHGLNTSSICGKLIGQAIAGTSEDYRLFESFGLNYNYGVIGRSGVQLSYWMYQIQDWLDEL